MVWVPSAANGCKEMGPWRREDLTLPANAVEAQNLTWTQLQVMAARVLGELPAGETSRETVTSAHATSATVTDNGAIE